LCVHIGVGVGGLRLPKSPQSGGKWSATQVMRLLEADRPFDASAAA
jgi:hypothetical protein